MTRLFAVATFAIIWGALTPEGAARRPAHERGLTLEARIEGQRAIEQVYWSHRIWPDQARRPKPALSAVMPESALRAKVEMTLRESSALESLWKRPITADQLQGEMNRMAERTRNPQMLAELFAALGNDPTLIAETLARPALADRLAREMFSAGADGQDFDAWWAEESRSIPVRLPQDAAGFTLAAIETAGCIADSWRPLSTAGDDPTPRHFHAAVWTGAEMIVWGGRDGSTYFNSGGRYDPATDTWAATSMDPNDPEARQRATGVWTGTEMIVWGGYSEIDGFLNSGGRYNPLTNAWTPTSTGANVPSGRSRHAAVWTGSEMIVWGGFRQAGSYVYPTDGGRYDPSTDTWTPTSTGANLPEGRAAPTAVWAGSQMIVWGGDLEGPPELNTGGRYDPATDTWAATSIGTGVPVPRSSHAAVSTGSQMIVWGGFGGDAYLQSGGLYDPSTDSWTPTAISSATPSERYFMGSVWTGSEMIVWGGYADHYLDTGGRYNPATDLWTATSTGPNDPEARYFPSAVWTGAEMLVWSGLSGNGYVNTGGRYCSCAAPVPAYRDADGDGFGDASVAIAACGGSAPAGYVANATDCNDASPAIHPGASDVCNGVDDNCDSVVDGGASCNDGNPCTDDACGGAAGCHHVSNAAPCDDGNACTAGDTCGGGSCLPGAPLPPPGDVQGVVLEGGPATRLTWTGVDSGDVYDIAWSTLSGLAVNGTATAACLANDVADVSFMDDQPDPASDDGYYYLIRAQSACGAGSYGVNSMGAERTPSPACP